MGAGSRTTERRIGAYKVVGDLGGGGMGVVHLVVDQAGRRLALKQVRPELAADPEFRSRFRREVAAAQRVTGRFTADVVDADVDADIPYVVTEYIDGPNLAEVVARSGPLSASQVNALAVGLAAALGAIHQLGLVHRDVKPSNVLLDSDGPRLIDFGIAHAADATQLTKTGVVTGSPGWMSPEQVRGEPTGQASDVFSWAATVAYAATGRNPFGEGRTDAILYRVIHEPADLNGIPGELRAVLARALAKDPLSRPSASELMQISGLTVVHADDVLATADETVARLWTRDTAWLSASSVEVFGEPAKTTRRRRWVLIAAVAAVAAGAVVAGVLLADRDSDPTPGLANEGPTEESAATSTSSTTTTTMATTTTTSTTVLPDAASMELTALLPAFHDELERLIVPRPSNADAILVASAPRQPEPRPLTMTLLEWDRSAYAIADHVEIDCSFVEQLIVDEDQAIFLGCTGGASAHYAYAFLAEPLDINVLPWSSAPDEGSPPGWLIAGFDNLPRPGQPDDLTLYGKRCDPSCADSKTDVYDLVWNPSFRQWDLVSCTEEGGGRVLYDPPWNGSVDHITFNGCPR